MRKIILSAIVVLAGLLTVQAQNVNIPDANFKAYLVGNTTINTNSDTEIQVSEAAAFNGDINCSGQSISNLTGIEAFTNLTQLYCGNNQLTSLNVSSNTALTHLSCSYNLIASLDVSNNTALVQLLCTNNQLTGLNVANGTNTAMLEFYATGNPNLTCIAVDNAAYSTANWTGGNFSFDAGVSFSNCCSGGTVTIPDANFKAYLVGNSAINTNGDTEIQCNEAATFTGFINCPSMSITDLTGIQAFTGITELYCSNNLLTNLDVSNNTTLIHLFCNNNQLTSLDISGNTALAHLYCNDNQLTSLDISSNTALTHLYCNNNRLTSLDISNNTALTHLYCNNNQLTSLDISNNAALTHLSFFQNQLTSLDVSSNTTLIELRGYSNQLTSLDVSNNTALTQLRCDNNQLTSLDASNNTALTILQCQNNLLTALNVANGNNSAISGFNATGNPNLTCIQVDDTAYSSANWTNIDTGASFSENCSGTTQYTITTSANPSAGGTVSGGGSHNNGTSVTLTATPNTNYQFVKWTEGGTDVSTDNPYTFTASADRTLVAEFETTTGINDVTQSSILNIYPNPTNSTLHIEVKENTNIKIVNLLGAMVATQQFNKGKNSIDVSGFTSGVYFLHSDKGGVVKFVKK